MKSSISLPAIAVTLLAMLVTTVKLAAQELTRQGSKNHHQYQLIDMGTFGGPQSYVTVPANYAPALNDQGAVAGWADTSTLDPYPNFCFNSDCFVSHAFQSQNGITTDLGALPGGASSASNWISANGLIAGASENGEIDPLISEFPEIRAVLWEEGSITNLGTLPEGGYESLANAVNSRGDVVGLALDTTPDPNSMVGLGYQTRAFLWQKGVMRDLGTLGGTDGMAVLVNERGQIVGDSYTGSAPSQYCADNIGFPLATGAFIWESGKMVNLGSFGGTCTFASDLNNRGQVIGLSTTPGDLAQHPFIWDRGVLTDMGTLGGSKGFADALNDAGDVVGWANLQDDQAFHAFLWKNRSMTDLGTVGGDACSFGTSVNSAQQVVGVSVPGCDFSQNRASLWENGGPMVDLNTLIPPDSTLHLTFPETINDRGEIAGNGVDSEGNQHAFLLIPCKSDDAQGCQDASTGTAASRVSPARAIREPAATEQNNSHRQLLSQRYSLRNHIPRLATPKD